MTAEDPAPQPTLSALQLDVAQADHVLDAVERAALPGVGLLRPAHVSLGYPWLAPAEALGRGVALLHGLDRPAFALHLSALRAFPSRGRRTVLYLEPDDPEPLRALAAALGVDTAGYRPHLSVARLDHDTARPSARSDVGALVGPLLPVVATARTLTLRVQYDHRWWRVERSVHLGTRSVP